MVWVKLNTDGSFQRNKGQAGCGGLIRGEDGNWLCGFSKNLGLCNAYVAELWGVLEGLQLALSHGYRRVEVAVDSKVVANHINSRSQGSLEGWRLLNKIHSLVSEDWDIVVYHNYREANICADALATLGCL